MILPLFAIAAAAQLWLWAVPFARAFPLSSRAGGRSQAGTGAGAGVGRGTQRARSDGFPPVSVVVCYRNAGADFAACLSGLTAQVYPGNYEIVLVDDGSTDRSASLARAYATDYPERVRLLTAPQPTRAGKKDALTLGIARARYDHLLLTDADCRPASLHWLRLMTRPLRRGYELVLGVGDYHRTDSLLSRWQAFEARYVAVKYLALARAGQPFMGVGRNLAYRRSFFDRAGGFAAHADLPGGDDDLLVAHHADPVATACITQPRARTISAPHLRWAAYLRQRTRHQVAGGRYPDRYRYATAAVALSHGLFFLLGFLLLFSPSYGLALLVYAVRLAFVAAAYRPARVAGERIAWWELPLFDAALAPMYLYLAFAGRAEPRGW